MRKEIVDIDILVTSRNGDRKIMQSIRITSRPPSRIRKQNQLSQFRGTKLEQRPQIFLEVSFRELSGSKLSGLHPFDNMTIIH